MSAAPGPGVVIAAAGTGGHIYPGLSLAAALRDAAPEVRVSFVGTRRGLEGDIVPRAGYDLDYVDMIPFARSVGARRFALPAVLLRAGLQAREILRRRDAAVAVSMGGYAGAPAVLGARFARLPALVHESGAVPGRANLLAARLTSHVAVSFPSAAQFFPRPADVRVTGMPLGAEFRSFDRDRLRAAARRELDLPAECFVVFVMGGSQGAARLTDAAVELATRWRDRDDLRILLKTGARFTADVEERLARSGGDRVTRVLAYVDRMDAPYAAADAALCRAGAGTVAELALTGLPAVLVPYPLATGDHQRDNAAELVAAGGAVLVPDDEAVADRLAPLYEELRADPVRRQEMADAARSVARPQAAEQLAGWVLELAAGR